MKNFNFLIVFLLFSISAFSQDRTYRNYNVFDSSTDKKVMVVPFEDKMFLSDINREIGNRTGLTYEEIKSTFREGLVQTLVEMGSDHANYIDPFELEEEEMHQILGAVYSHISYDYSLVEPLEAVDDKNLLDKIFKGDDESEDEPDSGLVDGQIATWYDGKERYMNAVFTKEDKIKELFEIYDLDHLLIITELDIKVMRDVNRDVGQTWPRRVKIHFTIFNSEGQQVFGSAAYNYFAGDEKDIYSIIRKSFDYPVAQIISKITPSGELDLNTEAKSETTEDTKGFKGLRAGFLKLGNKE